jgi:NADPH:quinone reductase-like Zn-dependent oxidoreductase
MNVSDNVALTATAVTHKHGNVVVAEVNVPSLQAHEIYINVEFAASNPTDSILDLCP